MSSIYYSTLSREVCGICLESMEKGGSVVAHKEKSKQRIIHPFHKKCIVTWLEKQKKCPICFIDVDKDSLNDPRSCNETFRSKMIREIKILSKDAIKGASIALCYLIGISIIIYELNNVSAATLPTIITVIFLYIQSVKALKGNYLAMLFPAFILLLAAKKDKKFPSFILQYEVLTASTVALESLIRRNIKYV